MGEFRIWRMNEYGNEDSWTLSYVFDITVWNVPREPSFIRSSCSYSELDLAEQCCGRWQLGSAESAIKGLMELERQNLSAVLPTEMKE
nr:hypothetical protein [Tanacetum cinerariifolium]GEY92344.1 hypothetical protein [Tanacetum cinerariifolium]